MEKRRKKDVSRGQRQSSAWLFCQTGMGTESRRSKCEGDRAGEGLAPAPTLGCLSHAWPISSIRPQMPVTSLDSPSGVKLQKVFLSPGDNFGSLVAAGNPILVSPLCCPVADIDPVFTVLF